MIKHKEIYASIYIRSLIAQNNDLSFYEKSIVTHLSFLEHTFAINNRELYEQILYKAIKVWTKTKDGKEDYLVQNAPLISAIYHQAKDELHKARVNKLLFRRVMEKYHAIGDDKYEARSNQLAIEIFKNTQEIVDGL